MSRHNRRRSRGGRKHASPPRTSDLADDAIAPNASIYSLGNSYGEYSRHSSPSPVPDFTDRIPQLPANMPLPRSSAPSARVWHNRYMAWQARKQSEELAAKIERGRVFGSLCSDPFMSGSDLESSPEPDISPDEAEELEAKMMDYFQGLDWLE